jgi:hypothetical protein
MAERDEEPAAGKKSVSDCAAWRPVRPSASRNSRSDRVASPAGAGQARSTRRTSRPCHPSGRPASGLGPHRRSRSALPSPSTPPHLEGPQYTLSSFTLGPGFARPGIVAHLSSSKPWGHPALMSTGVTCRLGVPTRHPTEAQGVRRPRLLVACGRDRKYPLRLDSKRLMSGPQPRPSGQAAWTLSRQPMILRSFVSTLASSREICIWLMPSSAAMAD